MMVAAAIEDGDDIFAYSYIDKKTNQKLNLFWLGFIIYTSAYTISTTTFVNYNICQGLQTLGMILFLATSITLVKFKFDDKRLKGIYTLYCIWLIIIMSRGFLLQYDFLKTMFY